MSETICFYQEVAVNLLWNSDCIKSNNFEVITYIWLTTCLQRNGDNEPSHEKPGCKNRQPQHSIHVLKLAKI